uniref:C2 domain-containing protein n=1 Tax=Plectus sambesii TaxID=2011161 RepID=A0A914XAK0_9BILA
MSVLVCTPYDRSFTTIFFPRKELDFTAEYTVLVSDLLIYYLQTDSTTIELHQAIGTNYKTWAAGAVFMRELLSAAHGRIFGRVTLVGTASEAVGGDFGQLEYSIHLKVPLERALNMYKERALAMGFVAQDMPTENRPEADQTNQLSVIVHRCVGLKSNQPGVPAPSPYVMYQVFDFPHHSTAVHQVNINPEFGDQHVWTLPVGPELDQYLRTKSLRLAVFDDAAANDELSYLGHVEIPLLPLSHNKPITGTFSLKMRQDKSIGTIDVSISWKFVYVPPKESLFVTQPLLDLEPEKLIEVPPDTSEDDIVKPIRRIGERKPILPVPKGTLPFTQNVSEVTGTVTVAEVHEQQIPEREDRSSSSSSNRSSHTSPPAVPPAKDDELDAFKSKPRLLREESFTITKPEPETERVKPPLVREDSIAVKKGESSESEEEPPKEATSPPSILGKLPAMPPLAYPRSSAIDEQKNSSLPAVGPVAPPRKPRVVEFSEPLHESIPPSESQSRASDEDEPSSSKPEITEPAEDDDDDGARVAMRVQSLQLVEDSPLLDREYDGMKAFIEWKFLDLPQEECETPASLPLPRKLGQLVDYDCYKDVPLNDRRIALLKQWATLDTKMEFTLVSDPGDAGDCDDLGVAQLSLQSVLSNNQQTLTFYNVDGFPVAEVDIDVHYSDSLIRAFAQA